MEWNTHSIEAIPFIPTELSHKGIDGLSFKDLFFIPFLSHSKWTVILIDLENPND